MNVTPERWQQIARIYELAVEQDPALREAFLASSCAGDDALRHEVESLLGQDEASVVLDRPVWATAAPLFDEGPELRPGAALGPYRVEGLLGVGGMGRVFRATDTRLNRPVAIKVLRSDIALDQQMRARFGREARAVAALTHPHICTLYDLGRQDQLDFLVMEYLEGDTLATRLAHGQLALEQALTHAIEIAGALDHAHRRGIVHRDLKPGNIMLTTSGAKLLDFGLAKFRSTEGAGLAEIDVRRAGAIPGTTGHTVFEPSDRDEANVTRGGAILGTVRYMSPEQIESRDVDARSDLFSFGAVLYEMLTGRRAFDGESVASVRAAILEREPPPASSPEPLVPPAVDEIVCRCLAKDPRQRWRTAGELLSELSRVSESGALARARLVTGAYRSAESQIRSIAVLPLDDLSGGQDQEYFADGMTEQLIADLATISGLRVISRTSVAGYRHTRKPVPTIARELRVDAIIEGAVVRANDKVRITAKLVRGGSGEIIWSQDFERDLRDVLRLQREVARTITSKVDLTLTPQEQARLASAEPVDPEVHRQVLLGRYHTAKATEDALRRAVQYLDGAVSMAPANALAHASLADAYIGLSGYYVPPREAMPRAKRAAETALALDESLADAHAALGFIHLVYEWEGPAAEKALLRALGLNPTLATARLHYAAYLTTQSRREEAVREIQQAVRFDPVSIRTNALATSLLLFTRRYDDAIELARRGMEFEPHSGFALAFQGVAYAEQGRFDEAVLNMEKAAQLDQSPTILALQAHVLAVAGRKEQAKTLIQEVEASTAGRYFCPYEIASAYVSLGDADTADRWFRKGLDDRADCMAWLGVEPWIEPFRSDPRYASLLREIGLDPGAR